MSALGCHRNADTPVRSEAQIGGTAGRSARLTRAFRGRVRESAIAEEVGEQLHFAIARARVAENFHAARHRDLFARTEVVQMFPSSRRENWMRRGRLHGAPESRGDAEDGLFAIIDKSRRLGEAQPPVIAEREQPRLLAAEDLPIVATLPSARTISESDGVGTEKHMR